MKSNLDTVRSVYRLQRILCSPEESAETTFKLCAGFGVTKQQVLDLVEAEESRRKEILAQMRQLQEEMNHL